MIILPIWVILEGMRGTRKPTFWSGGYRTPHFLRAVTRKLQLTSKHGNTGQDWQFRTNSILPQCLRGHRGEEWWWASASASCQLLSCLWSLWYSYWRKWKRYFQLAAVVQLTSYPPTFTVRCQHPVRALLDFNQSPSRWWPDAPTLQLCCQVINNTWN